MRTIGLDPENCLQSCNFNIPERVKSEPGLIDFQTTAPGDVNILLPCNVRRPRASHAYLVALSVFSRALDLSAYTRHWIERSILVQQFAVAQQDPVPGGGAQFQPDPASEILSHVEDVDAFFGFREFDRFYAVGNPDRLTALPLQLSGRSVGDRCPRPSRIVETGLLPARPFESPVINLAQVYAVAHDRSFGHLPALIADDGAASNIQLSDKTGPADRKRRADIPVSPHSQRQRVVPAVTQRHTDAVAAGSKKPGDIINTVQRPVRIIRPERIQHVVADLFAVERGLIIALLPLREAS